MRTPHKIALSLFAILFVATAAFTASAIFRFAQGRFRVEQILKANQTDYTKNPQIKAILGAPVTHLAISKGWTTSSVFATKDGIVIHLAGKITEGDLYLRAKKSGTQWTITSATLVTTTGYSIEINEYL